ncbi:MAG: LON peptidase substrate-binding domain-containing protein [Candidatus Promineifilaceae bacterium]|nr:LON peptidase substrate-binding domain-containing protein [Candidatus Promineifilaceae bacterium]
MNETTQPTSLPLVPLRGGVVFPGVTTTISVGRRKSLAAAQAAAKADGKILIGVQFNSDIESPGREDLAPVAILSTVRDVLRTSHLGVQMLVEMEHRVNLDEIIQDDPYLVGNYREMTETTDGQPEALMAETIAYLEQYVESLGEVNRQVMASLRTKETAGDLADFLDGILNLPFDV